MNVSESGGERMSLENEITKWLEARSVTLNLHDREGRTALMLRAGLSPDLQQTIKLDDTLSVFCPVFVKKFLSYGTLDDGRGAMAAVLSLLSYFVIQFSLSRWNSPSSCI